jgi:lipopolysaccharide transport system permease protein
LSSAAGEGRAAGATALPRLTVIEPRSGWAMPDLRELWEHRELLWVLAARDIRVRYKQTVLGAGWALLRPLLAMLVFTLVFGRLAKMPSDGAPYPVFVLAALLPWTFFSTAATGAAESLLVSQALVSKIYFPRLVIPISRLGVALLDLGIGLVFLGVTAVVYGYRPTWSLSLLPAALVLLLAGTLAVGTLLASLSVVYRDVRQLVPYAMQLGLYATPVVYPVSLFPERWRWALYLNPIAGPVEAFRSIFLGRAMDWHGLAVSAAVSAVLLVGALAHFARVDRRLADIV